MKIIILKCLYYSKMAKEMNVSCDFFEHKLNCILSENTMDVLLKVQTRLGEHTFREDVYMRTLKYRRWNNKLWPFQSLKKRVVQMFQKRNYYSDSSRGTSTQMIMNEVPEQCKPEPRERDSETDSDRESIHSNWSELVPIEINKPDDILKNWCSTEKKDCEEHSLVPYKPKPKDWGSWKIKSIYATSTIASPCLDNDPQAQDPNQTNEKLSYDPHSPYYEPVHPPQFYEDEWNIYNKNLFIYV